MIDNEEMVAVPKEQIDFLLIRISADLIVNSFTTFKFLQGKEVNRRMYYNESHMKLDDERSETDDLHKRAEEMTDVLSDQSEDRPLNPSNP